MLSNTFPSRTHCASPRCVLSSPLLTSRPIVRDELRGRQRVVRVLPSRTALQRVGCTRFVGSQHGLDELHESPRDVAAVQGTSGGGLQRAQQRRTRVDAECTSGSADEACVRAHLMVVRQILHQLRLQQRVHGGVGGEGEDLRLGSVRATGVDVQGELAGVRHRTPLDRGKSVGSSQQRSGRAQRQHRHAHRRHRDEEEGGTHDAASRRRTGLVRGRRDTQHSAGEFLCESSVVRCQCCPLVCGGSGAAHRVASRTSLSTQRRNRRRQRWRDSQKTGTRRRHTDRHSWGTQRDGGMLEATRSIVKPSQPPPPAQNPRPPGPTIVDTTTLGRNHEYLQNKSFVT